MGLTEVSIGEALLIALSGILVVFLMLAILSVVIKAISTIPTKRAENAASGDVSTASGSADAARSGDVDAESSAAGVPYGGTIKLLDVDEKTAACVMAIVSHETGIPLNQLIFKSIKALNE